MTCQIDGELFAAEALKYKTRLSTKRVNISLHKMRESFLSSFIKVFLNGTMKKAFTTSFAFQVHSTHDNCMIFPSFLSAKQIASNAPPQRALRLVRFSYYAEISMSFNTRDTKSSEPNGGSLKSS